MFSQTPVGTVNLYNNPLPKRIWHRNIDIISRYTDICMSIEMGHNPLQAKAAARRTLMELVPLYEGEAIISLLVEALSPQPVQSDQTGQTTKFPIIMADYEAFSEYRASQITPDINRDIQRAKALLVDQRYAFDLLHYNPATEKVLWIYMVYGLAKQPEALNTWKEQLLPATQKLVPLFKQYYNKDIKGFDIVCIDPLLQQSSKDLAIWSLNDADQITGTIGTAQKIAAWRDAALEDLLVMVENPNPRNEEKLRQLLTAEIHKIIHSSSQNHFNPELTVLIPK